jgi:hypothetical protein
MMHPKTWNTCLTCATQTDQHAGTDSSFELSLPLKSAIPLTKNSDNVQVIMEVPFLVLILLQKLFKQMKSTTQAGNIECCKFL